MRVLFCAALLSTFAGLPAWPAADAASSASARSSSAAGSSFHPVFSADGSRLVFTSHANDVITNDNRRMWLDVFLRDAGASNTVLVSVNMSNAGGGNANSFAATISSNGHFVAFASGASDLVDGDTNGAIDIFVRDMEARTTRLVSLDVYGNAPGDPSPSSIIPLSGNPMISADGRWIFFESRATNLAAIGAPSGGVNIYRRDTLLNTTTLVSADTNGNPVNGISELASITPDGRFATFISGGSGFAPDVTATAATVYLRDVNLGTTKWVGFVPGLDEVSVAAIVSEDAKYVVFMTAGASNAVVRREVQSAPQIISLFATNRTLSIGADAKKIAFESGGYVQLWSDDTNVTPYSVAVFQTNATVRPVLSRDGRSLVFTEATDPDATQWRLFLRDSLTNIVPISLTMIGSASSGNFFFSHVSLNDDGSIISFDATASDLVADDLNGASDVFLRDINTKVTEIITKAQPAVPAATSFACSFLNLNSISADGRFVVSTRYDDPSAFGDTNGWLDIFVSDVWSGVSVPISFDPALPVTNYSGPNAYRAPIISGNGTTIAAVRPIPAIGPVPGTQVTIARSSNDAFQPPGMQDVGGNGDADSPSISHDGVILAFRNGSEVLVHYSTALSNGSSQGSNYHLSQNAMAPVVSPDGAWIAFASTTNFQLMVASLGTNRAAPDFLTNVPTHLGTYTISTQAIQIFTVAPPATNVHWNTVRSPLPVHATNSLFSADSRYVFFALADESGVLRQELMTFHTNVFRSGGSVMTSNGPQPAYSTNLVAGAVTILACTNCRNVSVSADGNILAFERRRLPSNLFDVFTIDLQTGMESLVNVTALGSMSGTSARSPVISHDGRYVVFQTGATDLLAEDTDSFTHIFVRDRLLGTTLLVSANALGKSPNAPCTRPVMASDGRTVAFQSFANDLVSSDFNDKSDVFVLKLGGADTDGDGMDDDWEVAYFSSLSRNGGGDFDEDGATDLEEFLAGTDPANEESIFRVLTVTPAGGGSTQLIWSGNPTRNYRAEFKDDLSAANWTTVNGTISWNGSTATITDPTASNSAHRYYRVVRLP